jgi:hypothetical protein
MVFFSKVSEYFFKCAFKLQVGVISGKGEPAIFNKTPQDFNEVEFGGIGRQEVEKKSGFFPLGDTCFESVACVQRGIIERPGEGLAKGIETSNDPWVSTH